MMKKWIYLMITCLLGSMFLTGCGEKDESFDVWIYYIDAANETLITEGYNWKLTDAKEQASFILDKMRMPRDTVKCTSAIPGDVEITSWTLDGNQLELSFGEEYYLLDRPREVLLQAALVESLSQVDGVEEIVIRVGGELLTDQDGNVMEGISKEDYLLDTEEAFYQAEKHEQLEEEDVEEVEEMK